MSSSFLEKNKDFVLKLKIHTADGQTQIRRVPLPRIADEDGEISYEELAGLVVVFSVPEEEEEECAGNKAAITGKYVVSLTYYDDDKDLITLASTLELKEAIELFAGQRKKFIRITTTVKPKTSGGGASAPSDSSPSSAPAADPGTPSPGRRASSFASGKDRHPPPLAPPIQLVLESFAGILSSAVNHLQDGLAANHRHHEGGGPGARKAGRRRKKSDGSSSCATDFKSEDATAPVSAASSEDHGISETKDDAKEEAQEEIRSQKDEGAISAPVSDGSKTGGLSVKEEEKDRTAGVEEEKDAQEKNKEEADDEEQEKTTTAEEEKGEEKPFIHGRHTCDACLKTPIIGKRHRARNHLDYDLCQKCFDNHSGKERRKFYDVQDSCDVRHQDRWHAKYRESVIAACNSVATPKTDRAPGAVVGGSAPSAEPEDNSKEDTPREENEEEPAEEIAAEPPFIHGRHTCDGCLKTPIVGNRYHATNKSNYDLCQDCFDDLDKEGGNGDLAFETQQLNRDVPFQMRWRRRYARNAVMVRRRGWRGGIGRGFGGRGGGRGRRGRPARGGVHPPNLRKPEMRAVRGNVPGGRLKQQPVVPLISSMLSGLAAGAIRLSLKDETAPPNKKAPIEKKSDEKAEDKENGVSAPKESLERNDNKENDDKDGDDDGSGFRIVVVDDTTGEKITLKNCEPSDTIDVIKKKIHEQKGYDPSTQCLFPAGSGSEEAKVEEKETQASVDEETLESAADDRETKPGPSDHNKPVVEACDSALKEAIIGHPLYEIDPQEIPTKRSPKAEETDKCTEQELPSQSASADSGQTDSLEAKPTVQDFDDALKEAIRRSLDDVSKKGTGVPVATKNSQPAEAEEKELVSKKSSPECGTQNVPSCLMKNDPTNEFDNAVKEAIRRSLNDADEATKAEKQKHWNTFLKNYDSLEKSPFSSAEETEIAGRKKVSTDDKSYFEGDIPSSVEITGHDEEEKTEKVTIVSSNHSSCTSIASEEQKEVETMKKAMDIDSVDSEQLILECQESVPSLAVDSAVTGSVRNALIHSIDESFASDAVGNGDVAEVMGKTFDMVAEVISDILSEPEDSKPAAVDNDKNGSGGLIANLSDVEEDDNDWSVIKSVATNSTTQSKQIASATKMLGSMLFNSDMKSSTEQTGSSYVTDMKNSTEEQNGSSYPDDAASSYSIPSSVPTDLGMQHEQAPAPSSEEFGANMPPALESWCKEKMIEINGGDDLTLVGFCMTLNDADEIREYFTTYLGQTPLVIDFATEFIRKRGISFKKRGEEDDE